MLRLAACAAIAALLSTCAAAPSYAAVQHKHATEHKTPSNCGAIAAVENALKADGLSAISAGLLGNNALLAVYASDDRNSWAAVTFNKSGVACIVATGQTWMSAMPAFSYDAGRSDQ